MHPKLQKAIVATRSGRKKDAQHLLIDTLRDNPENADAWYLLSQLVEPENRQISYLNKTVEIEPGHPKAKQRLMQLGAIPVPAPIFGDDRKPVPTILEDVASTVAESDKPQDEQAHVPPQATRVSKQKPLSENATVDTDWRMTAGQPVTEKSKKSIKTPQAAPMAQPTKPPEEQSETTTDKPKRNLWLTLLLLILLIGIMGLFGYWLYLFFFNQI